MFKTLSFMYLVLCAVTGTAALFDSPDLNNNQAVSPAYSDKYIAGSTGSCSKFVVKSALKAVQPISEQKQRNLC